MRDPGNEVGDRWLTGPLDLPKVDLFFILDLFISLERSENVILSDEVARASASDVSRERSTCFTCRNLNQSVNQQARKSKGPSALLRPTSFPGSLILPERGCTLATSSLSRGLSLRGLAV